MTLIVNGKEADLDKVYASENVTDTLAHVVAVLEEAEKEILNPDYIDRAPQPPWLKEKVRGAIADGSALVEILRSKDRDEAARVWQTVFQVISDYDYDDERDVRSLIRLLEEAREEDGYGPQL